MKPLYYFSSLFCLLLLFSCSSDDNSGDEIPTDGTPEPVFTYYPPTDGSDTWETTSISELGWNSVELQPLLEYLEEKNSKSFIMLHNGKIVVESYMNNHSSVLPWYWASAGKTLTTAVTGIAQDEGLLSANDKVSDYIGTGWTSTPVDKEHLITCKTLLSMTSGLDDGLGDDISAENLQYLADAGDRWAYHNVYVKLQDVVANASNQSWSNYFNSVLKDRIGMSGAWIQNNDFNVYWSNARSMARFGLLISAGGIWEDTQIVSQTFLSEAVNTSQPINQAYGYMWWLNGKSTYRLPQTQIEFPGSLIPNAPIDMYCALGKDDQKLYIVPSKKLVIIRMGESADDANFALSNFDNELWQKINAFIN